jgi:hypothetical protein
LARAVVIHLVEADVVSRRIDLLSFVLKNEVIVLVFANAELACKSWRSARNRLLAACRVWTKGPWGSCGLSAWVVLGESEAVTCVAESAC